MKNLVVFGLGAAVGFFGLIAREAILVYQATTKADASPDGCEVIDWDENYELVWRSKKHTVIEEQ